MTWRIHSWSPENHVGTIESPHFGPVEFEGGANVDRVADFVKGEAVLVERDGPPGSFRVLTIRPMRQRQPEGTHWPLFDRVNGRFGDAHVEEQGPDALQVWLGDCCEHCTPHATHLRFEGITDLRGPLDELGGDSLFRLASAGEIEANHLAIPEGSSAFCVVTSHGEGPDGPSIFIVASRVVLT